MGGLGDLSAVAAPNGDLVVGLNLEVAVEFVLDRPVLSLDLPHEFVASQKVLLFTLEETRFTVSFSCI